MSSWIHGTDGWLPEVGHTGWVKWLKGLKRYKFPVIKHVSHGDVMDNMVTVVKIPCRIFERA